MSKRFKFQQWLSAALMVGDGSYSLNKGELL